MVCITITPWEPSMEPFIAVALLATTAVLSTGASGAQPPKPFGPVPTARQLAWHEIGMYGFVHFTINTFTDREWGHGDEAETLFSPTDFSADQIAETAAAAGLKGLVLTCKHHDGFCLWPSKYTEHSIKKSPWRSGKGDMVREIVDACRKHGLKVGFYLSPWDRNHAEYGRPAYVEYYRNQLRELLTSYGPVFEIWFDGANGGDGYYGGARENRHIDNKTYYDWPTTQQMVRQLQPGACMFSDAGPDMRWVGNESGFAGETCWATISTTDLWPGHANEAYLNAGDRNGDQWIPAEVDVSIRPGWFYHASEDSRVKTPEQLLKIYYESVGRGANLILNLPPDRRGRIHENDVASLKAWRATLDATFSNDLARGARVTASGTRGGDRRFSPANVVDGKRNTYWSTDDGETTPWVQVDLGKPTTFNVVRIREHLPLGQRIGRLVVEVPEGAGWREIGSATSIGNQRLLRLEPVTADRVRVRIVEAPVCPAISEVGLFLEPDH